MPSTSELKKALRAAGLEIYRTVKTAVHLADRVRENLIMDSGVRIRTDPPEVVFVTRAERSQFPGESDEQLHERARALGEAALAQGYVERSSRVTDVPDPSDPDKVLEHWYEVEFAKPLDDLDAAIEAARFAISVTKTATR